METETKPKTQPSKMVRCPANVHAMILELRRLMANAEMSPTGWDQAARWYMAALPMPRCILSCSGLCATCCNHVRAQGGRRQGF